MTAGVPGRQNFRAALFYVLEFLSKDFPDNSGSIRLYTPAPPQHTSLAGSNAKFKSESPKHFQRSVGPRLAV